MAQISKLWIILNPIAGKGKAEKLKPKIEKILMESGYKFEIIVTKGPGDALLFARDLPVGENDITVAAGGDGTCNEVVNGLLKRAEKAQQEGTPLTSPPLFGILPIGRGNDFSATPGIPENVEKAISMLLNSEPHIIDAGLVKGGFFPQGRFFINGIGIGFDTKVGFEAAKLKIKSGFSYAIGAFILIARYEPSPVIQIKYDDKEATLPAVLVSIVNGKRMGGSFYMGPKAILDDGLLDLCYVEHQKSRFSLLKILSHYTKGTQDQCKGVTFDRGKKFNLFALQGGMAAHCDGETICYDGKELEISCIPSAIKLIGAK
ncbi:MAG: diacylglycerol kinase family lipid kinase [Treponema sp.]|nr:diacylglycerol kinase family lipid kinase [Treponema sp.]MCL2250311.1 diacylglycerol kinase family lipid kinase [Treponema sp.]